MSLWLFLFSFGFHLQDYLRHSFQLLFFVCVLKFFILDQTKRRWKFRFYCPIGDLRTNTLISFLFALHHRYSKIESTVCIKFTDFNYPLFRSAWLLSVRMTSIEHIIIIIIYSNMVFVIHILELQAPAIKMK